MKKWVLFAVLVFGLAGWVSSEEQTRPVWVYFRDKRMPTMWEMKARESLSERSLARRGKVRGRHRLVDPEDLPLNEHDVSEVAGLATRIRQRSKWLNAVSVETTAEQESLIIRLPSVRAVRPITVFSRSPLPVPQETPLERMLIEDLEYGESRDQLAQIRVDHLHRLGFTGEGIFICILDTGFFKEHESLREVDVIAERDFIFNDADTQRDPSNPEDFSDSHGTATWSVLGGCSPGRLMGPAYGASFLLAKTEDLRYELPIEEDHWIAAVEWAEAEGADVISSSLAYTTFQDGTGYTFDDLDGNTAVTTLAADRAAALGVSVVVAAGNYRTTSWGHIGTPADGDSVMAVGAVDAAGGIASFSSPGPTADGRIKPEVCARGVKTYAASNAAIWAYGPLSGTSLATPLVAGAAALLLEANPEWTGIEVRSALTATADRSDNPDNDFGWGIIDAFAASGVQAPILLLNNVLISDDDSGDSMGNGNGIPEPGERIELTIRLTNDGSIGSGDLTADLTTQEANVIVLVDQATVRSLSPGDTALAHVPFVVDLSSSLEAEAPVLFSLVVRSTNGDTMLVDTLTITTARMGFLSGSVSEYGTGSVVGNGTIRVSRLDGAPSSITDIPVSPDGMFSGWLNQGAYAVQARKDAFVSLDATVVDLADGLDVHLELANPRPRFETDSLLVVIPGDTTLQMTVAVTNEGSGLLELSYHGSGGEESTTRYNEGWQLLRTDPIEHCQADIVTVYASSCSSEIGIRVVTVAPWIPTDEMRLVIGLKTDENADSGLEAAGIPADFKVEWGSSARLYRAYGGMWRYPSSVTAESRNDTLTVLIPLERLLLTSLPKIELAIRVEGSTDSDDVLVLETIPDDGGTNPITFSLAGPSWLDFLASSVSIDEGQSAFMSFSFSSFDLENGLYSADLILQGGFVGGVRFPVTFAVGEFTPLPENPILGVPYPNPSTSSFSVEATIPCPSPTKLVLTDLAGRVVQTWSRENVIPGIPAVLDFEIDPSVSRGVFLLRLEIDCGTTSSRVVVRD